MSWVCTVARALKTVAFASPVKADGWPYLPTFCVERAGTSLISFGGSSI